MEKLKILLLSFSLSLSLSFLVAVADAQRMRSSPMLITKFANIKIMNKNDKICARHVLADCTDRLFMLGDKNFTFPTNVQQMDRRCKELKQLELCIRNVANRCYTGDTRNSIFVVMFSVSKTNKAYCRTAKRKQAFIGFGPCANKYRAKMNEFMDDMNRDFHSAKSLIEPGMRGPNACCIYSKFKSRINEYLRGKCPEKAVNELDNLLENYAHDIFNLLCGDYTDDTDKCEPVIKALPRWTKPVDGNSFVITLIDMVESF